MLSWLLVTTLAVESPALDCALQPGAVWAPGPRDVSAIVCQKTPGFFVPSLYFRELWAAAKSDVSTQRELELAKSELAERQAIAASLAQDLEKARIERDGWMNEATQAAHAADEASARSAWESPFLWGLVGVVLGGGAMGAVVLLAR
jgi:hypothetical protein